MIELRLPDGAIRTLTTDSTAGATWKLALRDGTPEDKPVTIRRHGADEIRTVPLCETVHGLVTDVRALGTDSRLVTDLSTAPRAGAAR